MWVCAKAWSSSANLGPGFDVLAIAHKAFSDVVCVREGKSFEVTKVTGDYKVPRERNSALRAVVETARRLNVGPLEVWVHKGVPPGRGLGSSGASAAAAVKAVELYASANLKPSEAVYLASLGEEEVTGSAHADNVAASYLGGLVAVRYKPFDAIPFGLPRVELVILVPEVEVPEGKTAYARSLLPQSVSLRDAVTMMSNAIAFVHYLNKGELERAGEAMMNDPVVTKARKVMVPCFDEVVRGAREYYYGYAISGAGPSMIFLPKGDLVRKLEEILEGCGLRARVIATEPAQGAHEASEP